MPKNSSYTENVNKNELSKKSVPSGDNINPYSLSKKSAPSGDNRLKGYKAEDKLRKT